MFGNMYNKTIEISTTKPKLDFAFLNEGFVNEYLDEDGNISSRKVLEKARVVVFSGFKFISDRILAVLGLILASPIMAIIAIAIKLDSKGPVLFIQERTGKDGKKINIYKFRSMSVDKDVHDFKNADKHTKVGKLLRKTSLDELPQLISITKADMSL